MENTQIKDWRISGIVSCMPKRVRPRRIEVSGGGAPEVDDTLNHFAEHFSRSERTDAGRHTGRQRDSGNAEDAVSSDMKAEGSSEDFGGGWPPPALANAARR